MAEITLTEQRIKDLYLEKDEAEKIKGSLCQILNQFYTEVELVKPMPGQTLKSALALHETFFPANKLDIANIEAISNNADLRKSAFLRKQEEDLKENEKKLKEAEDTISEITGKGIDLQEKKGASQDSENVGANDAESEESQPETEAEISQNFDEDSEENPAETQNSNFETIEQFLTNKSPAFRLTSLHYLLSLPQWKNLHPQIQEMFATTQQEQKTKIGLFEKIIDNKEQGLSLSQSLEQEEFGELIEEFTALAKKMDEAGVENENLFLKKFLHHFKSEPKRNYEMLALVITMKYCEKDNVRVFLEKLCKKWPQKNEPKDKRVILEMTRRHLKIS